MFNLNVCKSVKLLSMSVWTKINLVNAVICKVSYQNVTHRLS